MTTVYEIDWAATAAWVQAVGSIAAIVGSVAVVKYQFGLQLTQEKARQLSADREFAEAALHIMNHVFNLFAKASERISDRNTRADFYRTYYESEFKSVVEVLQKIDEFRIPQKELIISFVEFKWLMERSERHLRWTRDQLWNYTPSTESELELLEGETEALGGLRSCVRDALPRLKNFEKLVADYRKRP